MEIGGLSSGTEHDAITFTTGALLGGTLDLQLINGFEPALGNAFDLFNGPTTGSFSSIIFPPLGPGRTWDASNLYTTGSLTVVVPEPVSGIVALSVLGLIQGRTKRTKCRW
jgi:hypothetical protein